jgi:hypothetical protein
MKYTILIILFSIMTALCFGVFQIDLGFDISGNHHWKGGGLSDDYSNALGVSPSLEYMLHYESILYGLGAEYQILRTVNAPGDNDGKISFVPIYLVGRYQFPTITKVTPEIVAQAGYNLFMADDAYKGDATLTGGLYWGIGGAVSIKTKYLIQLMYKTNYGKVKDGIDLDITNSQINLGLGYRL